jgi:putative phosphoesterase
MLKIGLIADTHIRHEGEDLYPETYDALAGVDLILHAGDTYITHVYDRLERIAPVIACRGNGDMQMPDDPRLKLDQVVEVERLRIGLMHDLALPEAPPHRTLETIMERRLGGPVDVIVFGDTHVAHLSTFKDVLLVNPGSPTYPSNYDRQLGTVAILTIENGVPSAELIALSETARRFLPKVSGHRVPAGSQPDLYGRR